MLTKLAGYTRSLSRAYEEILLRAGMCWHGNREKGVSSAWHPSQEQQTGFVSDLMVPFSSPPQVNPHPVVCGRAHVQLDTLGDSSRELCWADWLAHQATHVDFCMEKGRKGSVKHKGERVNDRTSMLLCSTVCQLHPWELTIAHAQGEGPGHEASHAHQHIPGCHLRTCCFPLKVTLEEKLTFQLCLKQEQLCVCKTRLCCLVTNLPPNVPALGSKLKLKIICWHGPQ